MALLGPRTRLLGRYLTGLSAPSVRCLAGAKAPADTQWAPRATLPWKEWKESTGAVSKNAQQRGMDDTVRQACSLHDEYLKALKATEAAQQEQNTLTSTLAQEKVGLPPLEGGRVANIGPHVVSCSCRTKLRRRPQRKRQPP